MNTLVRVPSAAMDDERLHRLHAAMSIDAKAFEATPVKRTPDEHAIAGDGNANECAQAGRPGLRLTAREHAILCMMSRGCTNKMIASHLRISPETVKAHAKRIFRKLTAVSRAEAVYRAVAMGLIGT